MVVPNGSVSKVPLASSSVAVISASRPGPFGSSAPVNRTAALA